MSMHVLAASFPSLFCVLFMGFCVPLTATKITDPIRVVILGGTEKGMLRYCGQQSARSVEPRT